VTTGGSTTGTFELDWDPAYRLAGLPFGITPSTARVEVTPTELVVRYGLWRLRSALQNIESTQITGDYAFVKTAGPPHLSFSDRGISFATNGRRGLCVSFRTPVRGIDPTGRITHPGATLTVRDPEGLAAALGHPIA
jgi:hypothetical protein